MGRRLGATYLETTAVRAAGGWVIDGEKTWNTGVHTASHDLIFARASRPRACSGVSSIAVHYASGRRG